MERQGESVLASGKRELANEALLVHADTHRGYLERAVKHLVVEEDISVKLPIVIVRGALIVRLSDRELSSETYNKRGIMRLNVLVFALLCRFAGVKCEQGLRRYNRNLAANTRAQLREIYL